MNETAATVRLDGRTVVLLLVTVVALAVVDAVLGRTLVETTVPALVADAAVALAVLVARRHLFAATLLAAAASVAVSGAVADDSLNQWAVRENIITGNFIVGMGAWPGIGEFAGMAVLCAMAIRYRTTAEAALAAIAYRRRAVGDRRLATAGPVGRPVPVDLGRHVRRHRRHRPVLALDRRTACRRGPGGPAVRA